MRPGQNKRMRGRNNNNNNHRKGPNPLTRSYESNGPDVKIRGNAHHIAEKYLQLARDAQSSGDPVMAESYLQHAEHYFRLIAAAQQAQQQAQMGYNRPGGEEVEEVDEDDDFAALPDRFASPVERPAVPQNGAPTGAGQPAYPDQRPYYNGNGGAERPQYDRPERQDRGPRPERPPYQERAPYQERPYQERHGQPRDQGDRPPRRDRPQRDFRGDGQPVSGDPRSGAEAPEDKGLPAFITAPVRIQGEAHPGETHADPAMGEQPDVEMEAGGFHLRPRRRRRGKPEGGADFGSVPETTGDPVD